MKELDLQKRIIDEVKAAGGWGRKWASSWQNGVPDLILVVPSFEAIFVEVKLVPRISFDFSRFPPKIETSPRQKQEMHKINKAGGTAFLMVGVVTHDEGRLYTADADQEHLTGAENFSQWRRGKIVLKAPELIRHYLLGEVYGL